MHVDIKDLEIMDVSSMDELQDGAKTINLMQSTIDKKNREFEIELEKHCSQIGMELCSCTPPEVSPITKQVKLPTPEELVNSYSYHALVETQGGVYANEQGIIRHCKKCGKNTFYGNPTLMLMGLSMFYNAMVSFDEMEIDENAENDEIIETPIAETAEATTCGGNCEGCTAHSDPTDDKEDVPENETDVNTEGAGENDE